MTTLTDRVIAGLRTHQDRLVAQAASFTDEQLATTSGSSDWDVAQVLSHLGSGSAIMLAGLTAAVAGEPSPGHDFNLEVWAQWDGMTNAQKRDAFVEVSGRVVEAYEGLDGPTRETLRIPVSWRPDPFSVAVLGGLRLNEVTLHAWDIAVAFDPAAILDPVAAGILTELFVGDLGFLPARFAKPSPDVTPSPVAARVELMDPYAVIGLTVGPDSVALTPLPPTPSDATVKLTTEAWLRLLSGRLTPDRTPEEVRVTGALTLGGLRTVFPGF